MQITDLELELEKAKKVATPVIVEWSLRTGRTGPRGLITWARVNEQHVERPVVKKSMTLEKSIDPSVGKVVSEDQRQRVITLTGSGTIRTDHR